jgi:hypothetical protein
MTAYNKLTVDGLTQPKGSTTMNRFEELQSRISNQGKSVFGYTVDWIEWSAKKNLEIAEDFADFTVSQLRLPVEVSGFADFRHSLRDSYGEFGDVLKHHSEDYVSRLKEVPEDLREIFEPKKVMKKAAPAKKAPARKKATKARASKPKAKKAA